MGSNLAEKFYNFISAVPTKKWWEFIRVLGLPESDIDEILYDDDDLSEQKYQMLSRWKSYYGYKKLDEDIVACLTLAQDEVLHNHLSQELNRKLPGGLQENRQIARTFYDVMRRLETGQRRGFAKTKLNLPETEVNSIAADYSKDVDEQCYQMFLFWKRRMATALQSHHDVRDKLESFLTEFLHQTLPLRQVSRPGGRFQQASWDTGTADGVPNSTVPNRIPAGDEVGSNRR